MKKKLKSLSSKESKHALCFAGLRTKNRGKIVIYKNRYLICIISIILNDQSKQMSTPFFHTYYHYLMFDVNQISK